MMEVEESAEKGIHPKEEANIISRFFNIWFLSVFVGKQEVEEKFYLPLKEYDCAALRQKLETELSRQQKTKGSISMEMAICRLFYKDLAFNGLLVVISKIGNLVFQPLIFSQVLNYFTPNQTALSDEQGLYYILALIVLLLLQAILYHNTLSGMLDLGVKVRAVFCGAVYSKTINSTKQGLEEFTSVGQIMNLLTNTATHVELGFMQINFVFILPIEIVAAAICLYYSLGYSGLAGLSVYLLVFIYECVFLCVFICFAVVYIKIIFQNVKTQLVRATESRLQLITEFFSGIQTIKIFGWDDQFAALIAKARNLEMKIQKRMSFIKIVHLCFKLFIPMWAMCITIIAAKFLEQDVTPNFVFTAAIYYNILTNSICLLFPKNWTNLIELRYALGEIKTFIEHKIEPRSTSSNKSANFDNPGICLENVGAKWKLMLPKRCLTDVNFSASKGLTAIIGRSGSGKRALLHTILGETTIVQGTLSVEGKISYSSQDPWIFPATVRQNILFGENYNEDRYSKVVRICGLEHDLAVFPYRDSSFVGERGVLLSGGQKARINLARAVYRPADIYLLDDPLSAVDTKIGKHIFEQCILDFLSDKCVLLVSHQVYILQKVQQIYVVDNGRIENKEFHSSRTDTDKADLKTETHVKLDENDTAATKSFRILNKEKNQTSSHSMIKAIFRHFTFGSRYCSCIVILIGFLFAQIIINISDFFLTFWVNSHQQYLSSTPDPASSEKPEEFLTFDVFLWIYAALAIICAIIAACRNVFYVHACVKSSQLLHNSTFDNISRAPMKFFNKETSGNAINKFSKDLGIVDQVLPDFLILVLQNVFCTIGPLLLISVVNYLYAIPSLIFFLILFLLLYFLMPKVTQLTAKNLTLRSSIYTQAMVSLEGLVTVNALNAKTILIKEFDKNQSKSCVAQYMRRMAFSQIGFAADCLCILFLALIILCIYFLQIETQVGDIGLIIFQIISLLTVAQITVKFVVETHLCSMSLSHIYEYTKVAPEFDKSFLQTPEAWPTRGRINFNAIYLKYKSTGHPVLKNISVDINPTEKIGIIGRTGSGKSSLISTLFRLYDFSGTITIDGVDTKQISLKNLRRSLTIIPQNPILFTGSLRRNLDPFNTSTDAEIWTVLEEVSLKNSISSLPNQLEAYVQESGNNFSHGERQLLCLARAILQNCKILVLDEVSSNIDLETDQLIQKTIRTKFKSSTILTIAHRLHTVIDSDKMIVLSDGTIVEFDHPYLLLNNPNGYLYNQVIQNGKEVTEKLTDIAKMHFIKRPQLEQEP